MATAIGIGNLCEHCCGCLLFMVVVHGLVDLFHKQLRFRFSPCAARANLPHGIVMVVYWVGNFAASIAFDKHLFSGVRCIAADKRAGVGASVFCASLVQLVPERRVKYRALAARRRFHWKPVN